ncbi:ribosome recycling factor family protein [Shewanella sp. OMA3-2]|uniref:ribosome recycling factor family protein n=1 Tax=Shewanella sp. OMA3-2 TaxID=2908650 RepID=UPI001F337721|nr:ribosome recycling factor family protein [Shewanella sp. OMA3-2]UJF22810.1 ribosome recycling factor family protein [Shewanella sp. OMA3-2]
MNEPITIALPSLIHRIGGDNVKHAKAVALLCDCELKRVRRSRNWLILGQAIQVQSFSTQIKADRSEVFRYLIQKIDVGLLIHTDKLESLEDKLKRLITQTPNITLSELMQVTDCTVAQARVARFNADLY